MEKCSRVIVLVGLIGVSLIAAGCGGGTGKGQPKVKVGPETEIGGLTQITTETTVETMPTWSRTGRGMLFVTDRFGGLGICKVDRAGGGGITALTTAPSELDADFSPDVSPNDDEIAFASTRARGVPQIFTILPGSRGLTQLTSMAEGAVEPSWSPDGKRLAFSSPDKNGVWHVWIVSKDGSNLQQISPGIQARWAPDGGRLVFSKESTTKKGKNWDIYIVNIDGSGVTQITTDDTQEFQPDWSPDGNWICYVSVKDRVEVPAKFAKLLAEVQKFRNYEICVKNVSVAGRGAIQLTHSSGRDINPRWSPDGKQIVFASDRNGSLDIWSMTPNVIVAGKGGE